MNIERLKALYEIASGKPTDANVKDCLHELVTVCGAAHLLTRHPSTRSWNPQGTTVFTGMRPEKIHDFFRHEFSAKTPPTSHRKSRLTPFGRQVVLSEVNGWLQHFNTH